MKIKQALFFIFLAAIFSACQSSSSIQRKMLGMRSELFYELTTPVYLDASDTIYLKPIDYSAILPYTTVKKKGGLVIPCQLVGYFCPFDATRKLYLGKKLYCYPRFVTESAGNR